MSGDVIDSRAVDDRALLEGARAGSPDALQELWRRHQSAARRYAASLTQRFDADDLVSEAFLRVFSTLRNGRGPNDALRPYLFVTIRNIAIKWAKAPGSVSLGEVEEPGYDANLAGTLVDAANRGKLQEAMSSLPEQWQRILWATEVQGQRPAELAHSLRLQPNSVAALAYRAREALKQAWVQVHIGGDLGSGEHRWVRERAGRYVCRALSARQRERFRAHLDTCPQCSILVRDAEQLAILPIGVLALILPLGAAAPPVAGVLGGGGSTVAARFSTRFRQSFKGLSRTAVSTVGATAAATLVLAVGAIAVVQHAGSSSAGTSAAGPSSVLQDTDSPEHLEETPGISVPTPSPVEPRPTPPPSVRSPAPAPTPGDAPESARAADETIERTTSPAGTVSSVPASTTFTLWMIAAGATGTATVEIVNDRETIVQRADTVQGSSAVFIAPPGVTFRPQRTLVNDYQYAGRARSTSAIAFTACATEDDARVLRCDVSAADPNASAKASWVWGPGDTRRIYLQVDVAHQTAPGALTGSARLSLVSNTSEEKVFDRPWRVDVSPPPDPAGPVVHTIDPIGDDIVVQGSAVSGHLVVISSGDSALGTAIADGQGRWAIALPWGVSGTLVAQST